MRALYARGELSPLLFSAWMWIARGVREGEERFIWEGNALLAKHEQMVALQSVIDTSPSYARAMWLAGKSDADNSIPGILTPFWYSEDFSEPDARWRWVEKVFWPAYKRHDAEIGPRVADLPIPRNIRSSVDGFPSTR
jgi:hypothetical protein